MEVVDSPKNNAIIKRSIVLTASSKYSGNRVRFSLFR